MDVAYRGCVCLFMQLLYIGFGQIAQSQGSIVAVIGVLWVHGLGLCAPGFRGLGFWGPGFSGVGKIG